LLQSKLRVGWTVGALVGGLVGRAVGGEEGDEEGVEDGSDDGEEEGFQEGHDDGDEEGMVEGREEGDDEGAGVATTGFLEGTGESLVCVGVGASLFIIIVILLAGHFIMLCILQLPLPPLPRRLLEVCSSLRTVFDGGSSKRGGGGIDDDVVPDVGAETASAFLLSKDDNARRSVRSEQKVRRIMARFEAGSEEKLPS
jgi:hypothetical protein